MNDNSLVKLLNDVEPKIQNIDKHRVEVKSLSDVYETMDELVKLGENSYKEIIDFYDQDFIYKAIKIGNSNADHLIEKYKSSKYLLKNEDPTFHELPQFKDSVNFMNMLYEYLFGLNQKIKLDYETKSNQLEIQEILNKYFHLLNRENIFIKDIDEFLSFLDLNELTIEDRLEILILVNKCNIKNYVTTNDIKITDKVNLSDITVFLKRNESFLKTTYQNEKYLEETLDKYLKDHINNLPEDYFFNKKGFLIHKIKKMYDDKKYMELVPYYLEFNKIIFLEKEFEKQEKYPRSLCFLFNEDKSYVRNYLENADDKYKSCILKNLIDLEQEKKIVLPEMCYNNNYIYLEKDFVVKTVYTFLKNGIIFVLGVLEPNISLEEFLEEKKEVILNSLSLEQDLEKNKEERDFLLKNIKLEDLVLTMDLDTLDVKMEEKDAG